MEDGMGFVNTSSSFHGYIGSKTPRLVPPRLIVSVRFNHFWSSTTSGTPAPSWSSWKLSNAPSSPGFAVCTLFQVYIMYTLVVLFLHYVYINHFLCTFCTHYCSVGIYYSLFVVLQAIWMSTVSRRTCMWTASPLGSTSPHTSPFRNNFV